MPRGKRTKQRNSSSALGPTLRDLCRSKEIWGLLLFAIGVVGLVALFTESQGKLSAAWSLLLRRAFGIGAFPIALLITAAGLGLAAYPVLQGRLSVRWQAIIGWEILFFCSLGLVHIVAQDVSLEAAQQGMGGGYVGWGLAYFGQSLIGRPLTIAFLGILCLIGLYWVLGIPYSLLWWRTRWLLAKAGVAIRGYILRKRRREALAHVTFGAIPPAPAHSPETRSRTRVSRRKKSARGGKPPQKDIVLPAPKGTLPPLDLLTPDRSDGGDDADARHKAEIIEKTLAAFGIPAQVVEWHRGPVVTQFGVEPGYIERRDRNGNIRQYKVRVSRILALQNDLALALAAAPIRIEAPVPGRPIVGIEVPNTDKTLVGLRGVLESEAFRKLRSPLRICLGRDVSGQPVVADLTKMPHLLIAGATGTGKSVCLNALIVSLLYQNTAEQLKLLLIDPKRVELTKYNGIPHLLAPVIIDPAKVVSALRWITREMEQRYKIFSRVSARDLNAYNLQAQKRGLEPLPTIIVFIDELADLMLAAPEDIERIICRLAQMARATGIHLVIATQRPSVDVVTGLIKANFPARISFAVTSQVDSRVVLDTPGAEKLLGRGDMLFMAPDSPKLQRIQGCYVSDREIEAVVRFLKQSAQSKAQEKSSPAPMAFPWGDQEEAPADKDDLLERAIALVRQRKRASASLLQRKLRIGYPRAARLIDTMEEMGIIGPPEQGGRARRVLDTDSPPTSESQES